MPNIERQLWKKWKINWAWSVTIPAITNKDLCIKVRLKYFWIQNLTGRGGLYTITGHCPKKSTPLSLRTACKQVSASDWISVPISSLFMSPILRLLNQENSSRIDNAYINASLARLQDAHTYSSIYPSWFDVLHINDCLYSKHDSSTYVLSRNI